MSKIKNDIAKVIDYCKRTVPNDTLAEEINSYDEYYIEVSRIAKCDGMSEINDADCAVFYRSGYIDAITTFTQCLEDLVFRGEFSEPTILSKFFTDGLNWEDCEKSKNRILEMAIRKRKSISEANK